MRREVTNGATAKRLPIGFIPNPDAETRNLVQVEILIRQSRRLGIALRGAVPKLLPIPERGILPA